MKQYKDMQEFLEAYVPDDRPRTEVMVDRERLQSGLEDLAKKFPDAEAVVHFENVTLDSSSLGAKTAVIVGPGREIDSVAACEGRWLNDLPSQRQHAQGYLPLSEIQKLLS